MYYALVLAKAWLSALSKCAGSRQFCCLQSIICCLLHTGVHSSSLSSPYCPLLLLSCLPLQNVLTGLGCLVVTCGMSTCLPCGNRGGGLPHKSFSSCIFKGSKFMVWYSTGCQTLNWPPLELVPGWKCFKPRPNGSQVIPRFQLPFGRDLLVLAMTCADLHSPWWSSNLPASEHKFFTVWPTQRKKPQVSASSHLQTCDSVWPRL